MNDLSRRGFVATGIAASLSPFFGGAASALTDAEARVLVDKVVGDINKVIASGKPVNSMIRDFETIFRKYADVPLIARSTLGADSKRATPAQLNAFTTAFRGYIARKYGRRFKEFEGGKVEVKSARRLKSWQEVKAVVSLRGRQPFDVSFYVSDRSGKKLFFDLIMEGISLRLTERTEITAMLDKRRGDINALISDLKKAG